MAADPQTIRTACRRAQELVAEAIQTIVALGPDAPSTLREASQTMGSAYTQLSWADPAVPYSVPRDDAASR
jgi:hypothetical protein